MPQQESPRRLIPASEPPNAVQYSNIFEPSTGFIIALLSGIVLWRTPALVRDENLVLAEYFFFVCAAAALVVFFRRYHYSLALPNMYSPILDVAGAGTLFGLVWFLGLRQFGGYDHSALIEAGWVQLHSLLPFRDYPFTYPPLYFWGAGDAFRIFGVRWLSLVLVMGCFAAITFAALSRQLRQAGFTQAWAFALAMLSELSTCVVLSFWHHNPVASMMVILVFVSALVCLRRPSDWPAQLQLWFWCTLLFLSKPNAWPVAACVLLPAFSRGWSKVLRAVGVLIAAVAAAAICFARGLNPLRVLHAYSALAASRGSPFTLTVFDCTPTERVLLLGTIGYLAFAFGVRLADNRSEFRQFSREYLCCAIAATTSLGMSFTNYELKCSDLMPLVIALAVVTYRPWSQRTFGGAGEVVTIAVLSFFLVSSCYWGITRMRVRTIGEGMFFEDGADYVVRDGFFAGLRTGPRFKEVLREIDTVVKQDPVPRVFFGPRMEFGYAAFHQNPPRGLPLWWHPGSSYTDENLPGILEALPRNDFDLLICLRLGDTLYPEFIRMPYPVVSYITGTYKRVPGYSKIAVFERKREKADAGKSR